MDPMLTSEPIAVTRVLICQTWVFKPVSSGLVSTTEVKRVGEEWENGSVMKGGKYTGQATMQQMSLSNGSPFFLE